MSRSARIALAVVLALCLVGAIVVVVFPRSLGKTELTAYFDNSNGIYKGDDVMILGVPVGSVDSIEPQPQRVKITFHLDDEYKVPADANAIIISPTLVTARAIQLTPAYTSGPVMDSGAVIPQERTAVPVEFDDLREQLEKLTETLQPTQPGGVSTLGEVVNTAADNLRGQGENIREMIIELSQTLSALGDHSDDLFGTLKNLSTLVKALRSSTNLLRQLNGNLSSATGLLANDSNEIGNAVSDLNTALDDVRSFVAENREPLGTAATKLSSISDALVESIPDLKQTLHVAPNAFQNFTNIYEPAGAALTGALSGNNFANTLQFICSAVQSASRLNAEQSSKLCVQYLAPIIKNRQYNFFPIGGNPIVGAQARPNEVTFSEDWLRPLTEAGRVRDFYEGQLPVGPPPVTPPAVGGPTLPPAPAVAFPPAPPPPPDPGPLAAEAPIPTGATPTDPAAGLTGIMVPHGGGS
jgi:phospholipid/cholesterol/gamma-HCH transport system substrate-binding protein